MSEPTTPETQIDRDSRNARLVERPCCVCKKTLLVEAKGCGESTYLCQECFRGSR